MGKGYVPKMMPLKARALLLKNYLICPLPLPLNIPKYAFGTKKSVNK